MRRKLTDQQVKTIKKHLKDGYKTRSIIDIFNIKYKTQIEKQDIYQIKNLSAYRDVDSDLNKDIVKTIRTNICDQRKKLITEIKFFLAEGYDENEILHHYSISTSSFTKIKCLYGINYSIAPEYNDAIEKRFHRKKVNIDRKIVTSVKEQYVNSNGNILLNDIANSHGIDNGTVSNIIRRKAYRNFGQKFNSQIIKIQSAALEKKKQEEIAKKRMKISKRKLQSLNMRREQILDEIKMQRKLIRQKKSITNN